MPTPEERWLDSEAGPVVRPYALTGGRTRHGGAKFDLIATVEATRATVTNPGALAPEQLSILSLARRPAAIVDLASSLDLPLGVMRILLADLRDLGLVEIRNPVSPNEQPGHHILREVLDGLRRL
jgi:hypothetical protein